MERAALYEFMSGFRYGVVSSIGEDGTPQSALVGISVSPELEIVFDTLKSSRKYPNLIARPACSVALGWPGEKTVQYEGIAMEPQGPELARYREIYFRAWPDGRDRLHWPGPVHLVIRPRWIRYSDFDQRPPLIKEHAIADGSFHP